MGSLLQVIDRGNVGLLLVGEENGGVLIVDLGLPHAVPHRKLDAQSGCLALIGLAGRLVLGVLEHRGPEGADHLLGLMHLSKPLLGIGQRVVLDLFLESVQVLQEGRGLLAGVVLAGELEGHLELSVAHAVLILVIGCSPGEHQRGGDAESHVCLFV